MAGRKRNPYRPLGHPRGLGPPRILGDLTLVLGFRELTGGQQCDFRVVGPFRFERMPPLKPDIRLQTVAADQLARCLCCRTDGRRGVRVDIELGAACADSDELTEPITYAMRYRTLEQSAGGTRSTVQLHGYAPVSHHSLTVICAGQLLGRTQPSTLFARSMDRAITLIITPPEGVDDPVP